VPTRMNRSKGRLGVDSGGPTKPRTRIKGRSHIRCALLRCAGTNVSCVLLAQHSNARRSVCVKGPGFPHGKGQFGGISRLTVKYREYPATAKVIR